VKNQLSYISELNIFILGGGIAGISAAWALKKIGAKVTLIERQSCLGGRLCSHRKKGDPSAFDNGPHLLLSSYTRTRLLFREMDLSEHFDYPWPGAIPFAGRDGRNGKLQEWLLPTPLNFAAGLFSFRLLSWKARQRAFAAARNLLAAPADPNSSIEQWLGDHSEEEERSVFWNPLISAALNCNPAEAPLQDLQIVFRDGFCKGFTGGRLGFAELPLGRIFNDKMQRILAESGIQVHTHSTISGVTVRNNKIEAVVINEGVQQTCDGIIAALPPWALQKWLSDCSLEATTHNEISLEQWRYNPISSVYLWAERRSILEPYTCTPECSFDWIFDFGRIWKDRKGPIGLLLGNKDIRPSKPNLDGLLEELMGRLPQLKGIPWQAWRWIKEHRATPQKPRTLWDKSIPQNTKQETGSILNYRPRSKLR
jgi:predicted NAD/FAD-binding protein